MFKKALLLELLAIATERKFIWISNSFKESHLENRLCNASQESNDKYVYFGCSWWNLNFKMNIKLMTSMKMFSHVDTVDIENHEWKTEMWMLESQEVFRLCSNMPSVHAHQLSFVVLTQGREKKEKESKENIEIGNIGMRTMSLSCAKAWRVHAESTHIQTHTHTTWIIIESNEHIRLESNTIHCTSSTENFNLRWNA